MGKKVDERRKLQKTGALSTSSPFKDLFNINRQLIDVIAEDMKTHGYDDAFPIIVWQHDKKCVVLDGHTRLIAAKKAGLEEVPTIERKFRNEDEALEYVIHCQKDRRNLTDDEIFRCIKELDKRKQRGGDRKSKEAREESKASSEAIEGKSAEETARKVGTSRSKVEKARAIEEKGDEKIKKEVLEGKKTINKAYNEIQEKEKKEVERWYTDKDLSSYPITEEWQGRDIVIELEDENLVSVNLKMPKWFIREFKRGCSAQDLDVSKVVYTILFNFMEEEDFESMKKSGFYDWSEHM